MAVRLQGPALKAARAAGEARVGPADAKAYTLAAGEYVQIEDLQGCQVSDFLAFQADRPAPGSHRELATFGCGAEGPPRLAPPSSGSAHSCPAYAASGSPAGAYAFG